jgi:hypothetical protein
MSDDLPLIRSLLADPLRPLGLSDIADLTSPLVSLAALGQWHRRGMMLAPRWTVSGHPAWAAVDVARILTDALVHIRPSGKAVRCGRTCPHCAHEEPLTLAAALTGPDGS